MSDKTSDPFESMLAAKGSTDMLSVAKEILRTAGDAHALFDLLLAEGRSKIGIPAGNATPLAELPPELREPLEKASLAACRTAGELLLAQGKLREAWMYLRPAGERSQMANALRQVPITDENSQDIVELALYEGVDVEFGYSLLLEHFGVCNAITAYEGFVQNRALAEQRACGRQLLQRVHHDLLENVVADIAQREGARPQSNQLAELVEQRGWLFADGRYHLDTTHLATTVRIARVLEDTCDWQLAADLCAYGKRLSQSLQYAADEPFEDTYPAHEHFFNAGLTKDGSAALAFFAERAREATADQPLPAQVYVQLLSRLGKTGEALSQAIRDRLRDVDSVPLGSSLIAMATKANALDELLSAYRQVGDVVGFAVTLLAKEQTRK
jgi:hypothetical protein